jgi:Arc/MetJ-type ribon-helix-helix transcriptional regulator
MADTEKLHLTLPSELVADVRELMDKDDHGSFDEVLEDALWQWVWRRRFEMSPEFREEIGSLWDKGIASGPSRDGEEVFKRLRERIKGFSAQTAK